MSDGREYIERIRAELEAGRRQWKLGRKVLGAFGYTRRRQTAIDAINDVLDDLGLITVPAITTDMPLEGYITFWLADESDGEVELPADQFMDSEQVGELDEVDEISELSLGDPAELALRVANLDASDREPLCVTRNDKISLAMTLMEIHDYSQLVVANSRHSVDGVISYKSIAKATLYDGAQPDFVRDAIDTSSPTVAFDAPLLDAIKLFTEHECVLVRGQDRGLSGILTPADISSEFSAMVSPFLLIGEIEEHLRWIVKRATNSEIAITATSAVHNGAISRPQVVDLTLGELQRILEHPAVWAELSVPLDKSAFCAEVNRMREVRNNVMHFREPVSSEEVDRMRRFSRIVKKTCVALAESIP